MTWDEGLGKLAIRFTLLLFALTIAVVEVRADDVILNYGGAYQTYFEGGASNSEV